MNILKTFMAGVFLMQVALSVVSVVMADRRIVIVRNHPALSGRAEADDKLVSWLSSSTTGFTKLRLKPLR